MEQLDRYREQLKVCDEKILQGLLERNRVVEEIMACKEKNGMKILQPDQEARQEAWLEEALKGCRHQEEVRAVFDRIHWGSKRIQARKLFSYNIVLIGFMGAGKSTISEYLNTLFAMDVVEMDQLIASGRECPSRTFLRFTEKSISGTWRRPCWWRCRTGKMW